VANGAGEVCQPRSYEFEELDFSHYSIICVYVAGEGTRFSSWTKWRAVSTTSRRVPSDQGKKDRSSSTSTAQPPSLYTSSDDPQDLLQQCRPQNLIYPMTARSCTVKSAYKELIGTMKICSLYQISL